MFLSAVLTLILTAPIHYRVNGFGEWVLGLNFLEKFIITSLAHQWIIGEQVM